MVSQLQFIAIAAFLIWCLVSSVSGAFRPYSAAARLVWREHLPTGWSRWREVHYGLTGADLRLLNHSETIDRQTGRALLDTVLAQARSVGCDAVQFAVICASSGGADTVPTVIFVSDQVSTAPEQSASTTGRLVKTKQ